LAAIGDGLRRRRHVRDGGAEPPEWSRRPGVHLLTVGGIIVSLVIIAATFPILTRITGPEVTRND